MFNICPFTYKKVVGHNSASAKQPPHRWCDSITIPFRAAVKTVFWLVGDGVQVNSLWLTWLRTCFSKLLFVQSLREDNLQIRSKSVLINYSFNMFKGKQSYCWCTKKKNGLTSGSTSLCPRCRFWSLYFDCCSTHSLVLLFLLFEEVKLIFA